MKISLIALSALLVLNTFSYAQQIKTNNPISEVVLSDNSVQGREEIVITLQPSEANDTSSISSEDFEIQSCVVTEGGVNVRPQQATFVPDTDKMKWTCQIPVGVGVTKTTKDALISTWSSFRVTINHRKKQDGQWLPTVSQSVTAPFNRCIRVPGVNVAFGPEKRTAENEITIPVQLNADLRVQVEMVDTNNVVVAKVVGGSIFLPRQEGQNFTEVVLKKIDDPTVVLSSIPNYRIVVKPLQPQSHIPFKDSEKANVRIRDFKDYSIQDADIRVLKRITPKSDGSVGLTFITTDRGNIRLFINSDKTPKFSSDSGTSHTFAVPASVLNDGANTFRFEGESSEGIKLSKDATFSFVRESRTYLDKSTIAFSLDDNDVLTIVYRLSRPQQNRWQFVDSEGRPGLGALAQTTNSGTSEYKAVINLAAQDPSFIALITRELKGEEIKTAPITIQIVNANDGEDIVGAFKFNFLKPNAELVKKMQDVINLVKEGKEKKAKPLLAEALGAGTASSTIDSIIGLFQNKQPEQGGSSKNIIYTALRIAGKIGAAFFGIPLPI